MRWSTIRAPQTSPGVAQLLFTTSHSLASQRGARLYQKNLSPIFVKSCSSQHLISGNFFDIWINSRDPTVVRLAFRVVLTLHASTATSHTHSRVSLSAPGGGGTTCGRTSERVHAACSYGQTKCLTLVCAFTLYLSKARLTSFASRLAFCGTNKSGPSLSKRSFACRCRCSFGDERSSCASLRTTSIEVLHIEPCRNMSRNEIGCERQPSLVLHSYSCGRTTIGSIDELVTETFSGAAPDSCWKVTRISRKPSSEVIF